MAFGTELNGYVKSFHLFADYTLPPSKDGIWYEAERAGQKRRFNVLFADNALTLAMDGLWYRA
jgi:hypothetical protein